MKLVLDMNLSPRLADALLKQGWKAKHWSEIGAIDAPDSTIMQWAREHESIVVTHDLDFGAILAATGADGPSVIQIRVSDVEPEIFAAMLTKLIRKFQQEIEKGALIILGSKGERLRILPLEPRK